MNPTVDQKFVSCCTFSKKAYLHIFNSYICTVIVHAAAKLKHSVFVRVKHVKHVVCSAARSKVSDLSDQETVCELSL